MQSSLRVYGAKTCPDTLRSRRFLDSHEIKYGWFDVDEDAEALEVIKGVNDGNRATPTIFFEDGSFTIEPSDEELGGKLGL
jgi:mycoredoxin